MAVVGKQDKARRSKVWGPVSVRENRIRAWQTTGCGASEKKFSSSTPLSFSGLQAI
jgi:hypothetical protein